MITPTDRLFNVIKIFKNALEKNISLKRSMIEMGFSHHYVSSFKKRATPNDFPDTLWSEFKDLEKKYDQNSKSIISNLKNLNGYKKNKSHTNSDLPSVVDETSKLKFLNEIIDYAIENGISLKESTLIFNKGKSYFSDSFNFYKTPDHFQFNQELSEKYNHYLKLKTTKTKNSEKDLNVDEKYDNRSCCGENRDENGKIVSYWYRILVRDEKPLCGTLTREEMQKIYENYPYVTTNTCSSYFPYLTFIHFKRILRVFNITKEKLFPSFVIEEHTEEEIALFALKAKEHASYKKIVEQKPIFIEKELREVQKELFELKEDREWLKNIIQDTLNFDNVGIKIEYQSKNNDKALMVYLSDHHIGACNKGSQYEAEYNAEIYKGRLVKILQEVNKQKKLHGVFESVFVVNLGDPLDGYNSTTVRGGHTLPQNMDSKEQFKTYVESMVWFFEELHKMNISNKINFISVGECNHGGHFAYTANLSLKYIFNSKFPDINVNLFEKNIDHINYGAHSLIFTHGKDNHLMKSNFPMHLDAKTETYINNYIKINKIKTDSNLFIKGDLHNYNTQVGKGFRYTNIPSIFGSSGWIQANFGYTQPAFVYQILDKNDVNVVEGYLGLD